jgi:cytochrome c
LSIAKKYFTIPDEYIHYYPKVPVEDQSPTVSDEANDDINQFLNKRKRQKGAGPADKQHKIFSKPTKPITAPPKANRLGVEAGVRSILAPMNLNTIS